VGAELRATVVVEAAGRSTGVKGAEAIAVMGGSLVSAAAAAAVVFTDPVLATEAGGAVTDAMIGAREGDVDVGAETEGLLEESP
jgi:hypothetical protein